MPEIVQAFSESEPHQWEFWIENVPLKEIATPKGTFLRQTAMFEPPSVKIDLWTILGR